MWNFYDELCIGIPSGIRIEECVVGNRWTMVRANGNVGIARTLGGEDADSNTLAQSMVGTYLRDAANHMKWNSLVRASVGVAAMNAFYNHAELLENNDTAPAFEGVEGKKIAVIGDLPNVETELMGCASLVVLPLPESNELGAEYEQAMQSEVVLISGDTLINQTLLLLLKLVGENTKVTLFGASVPAAPILFSFGNPVHKLVGVYAKGDETVSFAMQPVQPKYLHESEQVSRYEASPYKATKFNNAFNPWDGKKYDQNTWSELYLG